jgi:hypothetical protein
MCDDKTRARTVGDFQESDDARKCERTWKEKNLNGWNEWPQLYTGEMQAKHSEFEFRLNAVYFVSHRKSKGTKTVNAIASIAKRNLTAPEVGYVNQSTGYLPKKHA